MPSNLSSDQLHSGTVIHRSIKPEAEYTIDSALKSKNNFVYRIKIKSGADQEKDAVAKWTSHDVSTAQRTTREQAIDREIEILTTLRHPSIVRILSIHPNNTAIKAQYWATSHLDQVGKFFVTEYLPYNSLSDSYRKQEYQKDLVWIVKTFSAILDAVKLAHGQGIIHLDIKPGNILFRSLDAQGKPSNPVLIDWGGARYLKDNLIGQQYSEGYYAPERETSASPDPKMDVWALGGVLYAMLTGRIPDDKDLALSEKIEVRESKILYELCDLVRKMRMVDPAARSSISDIQESIQRLETLAAFESTTNISRERSLDRLSKTVNSFWISIVIAVSIAILFWAIVYTDVYRPPESPLAIIPTEIPMVGISPTPIATNTMEISPTIIQNAVSDSTPTPTLAPPPLINIATDPLSDCVREEYNQKGGEGCMESDFADLDLCSNKIYSGQINVYGRAIIPTPFPGQLPNTYKFEYKTSGSWTNVTTSDESTKSVVWGLLGTIDISEMDVNSNEPFGFRLVVKKSDGQFYQCAMSLKVIK